MYTEFEYNNDKARADYKIESYFGEFSSEARNRLLAKNFIKPKSLYDVYYAEVKDELLAKNKKLINTDLDEASVMIRNAQLAKTVSKIFSLEEQSEDFRKSLLPRNNISESIDRLAKMSKDKREELLAKNNSHTKDLLDDSKKHLIDNIKSNGKDVSKELTDSKNQEVYRNNNLSKNVEFHKDLEKDSKDFKDEDLAKNVPIKSSIEDNSDVFRNEDLAKNVPKNTDLETQSKNFRNEDLIKNVSNKSNIEDSSDVFRNEELAKNVPVKSSIEDISETFRNEDLVKNVPNNRNQSIYGYSGAKSSIEDISDVFRNEDLAKNVPKNTDLETQSKNFRNEDLVKNDISNKTDIEKDAIDAYRDNQLSKNTLIETDLEKNSASFRKDDLSKNVSDKKDLFKDSEDYRKDDLSNNVPDKMSLEKDSALFREDDLSSNVFKETNLEEDSNDFREDDLSNNVPVNTDLETDSKSFREDDLSNNIPIENDLEVDSVPFRKDDLSNNIPIENDLEVDSVPFRKDDLSNNVPVETDLEVDSVPFREDDLSNNVSVETDLEVDSVPFREDDLSNNVPVETDLETDSASFREDDLSNNVPVETDLETDSASFREGDLSSNVPVETDLETDSVLFRNGDLASNVPTKNTFDSHVDMYGGFSTPTSERNALLKSNTTSAEPSIDDIADSAREQNLVKNNSSGMFGFNVSAFGQSQYVGVSGVWAQGLLFRNLLMMKNVPGRNEEVYNIDYPSPSAETFLENVRKKNINGRYHGIPRYNGSPAVDSGYYDNHGPFLETQQKDSALLKTTLKVPTLGEISGGFFIGNEDFPLPMTPVGYINKNNYQYPQFLSVSSPIRRNLEMAKLGGEESFNTQKTYGVDFPKTFSLDYSGHFEKGVENTDRFWLLSIDRDLDEENYKDVNANYLIRLYLQSLSSGFGNMKTTKAIVEAIRNVDSSGTGTTSTNIADLADSYGLFDVDRIARNSRVSVVAPDNDYLGNDVEDNFDSNFGGQDNESMAFKKTPGNPIDIRDFNVKKEGRGKGVRNVLKRIVDDKSIDFGGNYANLQGPVHMTNGEAAEPMVYKVGTENGKTKEVRQKFSLRNPYAPEGAGRLIFYLKNYAIPEYMGNTMYFPPYIVSFQNSDSANWNSNTFLGRPEPVYTYNNSTREGSLTFFVLTDFAEKVTIGRSQEGNMDKIIQTINKNFERSENGTIDILQAQVKAKGDEIKSLTEKEMSLVEQTKNVPIMPFNNGSVDMRNDASYNYKVSIYQQSCTELDGVKAEKESLQAGINSINSIITSIANLPPKSNYSEKDKIGNNVYNIGLNSYKDVNGEKEFGIEETVERIDSMIKTLAFQPAYFSGSVSDFKKRMEFLSRLTRPARNTNFSVSNNFKYNAPEATVKYVDVPAGPGTRGVGGAKRVVVPAPENVGNTANKASGFSFTLPPVCHLRLGDWYDHDIVISNVSYDYSNSPWTIGGSKVQPMWATVSIQFNIIGPAGVDGGVPLTASDREGYFGTRS